MTTTLDADDMLTSLQAVGASIGVEVRRGDPYAEGLEHVGVPPSTAAALCWRPHSEGGGLGHPKVVICDGLESPECVEAALHELAHAKLGSAIDDDACYVQEAAWALAFPEAVCVAVHRMAAGSR